MDKQTGASFTAVLPCTVFALVFLSFRLREATIRNFLVVAIGGFSIWNASPSEPLPRAISNLLLALTVILSPLPALLTHASKYFLSKGCIDSQKSHPNPNNIEILYDPENAELDIIAVHGLASHVEKTWTHRKSNKNWLKDFLPQDIPTARIMTFRHNSKWASQALDKDLTDHGKQLLNAMISQRETGETRQRPLILVGHSFGGLLIEKALVLAKRPTSDQDTDSEHCALTQALAGVIFLGTPHAGSQYTLPAYIFCIFQYWRNANPILLKYLDPGSPETRILEDEFLKEYPERSFDFYELKTYVFLGIALELVVTRDAGTRRGKDSAPLDTDHSGLNKYYDKDDASYVAVRNKIKSMWRAHDKLVKKKQYSIDTDDMELLNELEPCNFVTTLEKKLEDLWADVADNTCEWIVYDDKFKNWLREEKMLWIHGNPGSGKTYLAKKLCHYISTNCRSSNLMFFFFNAQSGDRSLCSLDKFFQTTLHQLLKGLEHTNPEQKTKLFALLRETRSKGHLHTYHIEAWKAIVSAAPPSFLVIDALDECRDTNENLKKWLGILSSFSNLQIVITSRPIAETQSLHGDPEIIHLHLSEHLDQLNKDIERYIEQRIENSNLPSQIPRVKAKLKTQSNGMILFARLVLDVLVGHAGTEKELLDKMGKFPLELGEFYAERLKLITNKDFARAILQWLITSQMPMNIDCLRGVDTISMKVWPTEQFDLNNKDPPPGRGENYNGSDRFRIFLSQDLLPLIDILPDGTVRLVHTTLSEFLLGQPVQGGDARCPDDFQIDLESSHERSAMTCLTYLRWTGHPEAQALLPSALLENKMLGDYAVLTWPYHCAQSQERIMKNKKEVKALMAFFGLQQKPNETVFSHWVAERGRLDFDFNSSFLENEFEDSNREALPEPLHIAVYFNMWQLAKEFLSSTDINICDADGRNALHFAAEHGYPLMIDNLLSEGAVMKPDMNGKSPLHLAVEQGHHEALRRLLADESSKKFLGTSESSEGPMLIQDACETGWAECVDSLLEYGIDESSIAVAMQNDHIEIMNMISTRAPNTIRESGLHLVEYAGSVEMVKLLCNNAAAPCIAQSWREKALHSACTNGRTGIVEHLLDDAEVPVDHKDDHGRTPLHRAAQAGTLDIMERLLLRNADKNALDSSQETPLFGAVRNEQAKAIKRLLEDNTDVNAKNNLRETVLSVAVKFGHTNIILMLLERDNSELGLPGSIILHDAASPLKRGQEHIIDILLEHGAQIDGRDDNGGTALHRSVCGDFCSDALLDRLIKAKVPVDAQDHTQRTALDLAVDKGNLVAIEHLISAGAQVGQSVHMAVRSHNILLVQPFLKTRALDTRDPDGHTPLHVAAANGVKDIARALLSAGASILPLNSNGSTSQGKARKANHLEIGSLPNDGDADSQSTPESIPSISNDLRAKPQLPLGKAPLHRAVMDGDLRNVQLLLSLSTTDIGHSDQRGWTPLHYSASCSETCAEIALELIQNGAHVDAVDDSGMTPLHLAARCNNARVTQYLVDANAKFRANGEGYYPLHLAALVGAQDVITVFVEKWDSDEEKNYPLREVYCHHGNGELGWIEHTVDIRDTKGQTALFLAARNCHLNVVEQLVRAGAVTYRFDSQENMAIDLAADEGHAEVVEFLLDELTWQVSVAYQWWRREADWLEAINNRQLGSLTGKESKRGELERLARLARLARLVRLTFKYGRRERKFLSDSYATIYWAPSSLYKGFLVEEEREVYGAWLRRYKPPALKVHIYLSGLFFDWETEDFPAFPSITLLDYHKVIVTRLLSGTTQTLRRRKGKSTLTRAVEMMKPNVVEILLKKLPELPREVAAVSFAVKSNAKIAGLLLRGAWLNQLYGGSTALHIAVEKDYKDVVRVLVDNGADDNIKDQDGDTPLYKAAISGNRAVLHILLNIDSDQESP